MKKVILLSILAVLVWLAACTPTVPKPDTQTPTTPPAAVDPSPESSPSVSSPLPDVTSPPVGTAVVAPGQWHTLSSGDEVLDLLVDDNEVWAATTGGVVRLNTDNGTYQKYTTLDGLASNTVREIICDKQGNIWVTCYVSGVSRFSGDKWESFTVKNGLVSDQVITLASDKHGGIWVSAYWGVSYFDGEQWSSYSNVGPGASVVGGENPMKDCQNLTFVDADLSAIDDIFTDSRGNVWFSNRHDGATRYDGISWKTFTEDDGMGNGGVSAFFEDSEGNLWFGSVFGDVTRYDGDNWESFTISNKIPKSYVQNIAQDQDGNIWVTAYSEVVVRYDGTRWRDFTTADGLPGNHIKLLFMDKDNKLCAVTDSGLSRYERGEWWPFTDKEILTGTARTVDKDNEGNLWFGSVEDGVIRFDGIAWQKFVTDDGLTDNTVTALAEDNEQAIWFGTRDGSVSRYDSNGWQVFRPDEVQAGEYVLSLLADSRGNIWAIGENGVSLYDGTEWLVITAAGGLTGDRITPIFEDSYGNVWLGADGGGVNRFDGISWQTFTTADGLGNNIVNDIAQDSQGNLWFAGGGISRFDGANWQSFSAAGSIRTILPGSDDDVWFITEDKGVIHFDGTEMQTLPDELPFMPWQGGALLDSNGDLWMATFYTNSGGLHRYDGNNWETFTPKDGLAGYQVSAMLEDRQGNIWAITDNGVSCFDGTEWRTFTSEDGLASNNVICIMEDSRGNLWFGTYGGVSYYSK